MSNYLEKRFVPRNAEQILGSGCDAVVYRYQKGGNNAAIGYRGNRPHPSFHLVFKNEIECEQYINRFFDQLTSFYKKKTHPPFFHTLHRNDILSSKTGCDRTCVEFYQVVSIISKRSVLLQKVRSQVVEQITDMTQYIAARKNAFYGFPFVKIVMPGNCVKISAYEMAKPWNGQPIFCSVYA